MIHNIYWSLYQLMTVVFTLTDHSSILLFVCLSSYPFQSFQNIENKTLATTFIRYSLELTKIKFIGTVKKCVQFFSANDPVHCWKETAFFLLKINHEPVKGWQGGVCVLTSPQGPLILMAAVSTLLPQGRTASSLKLMMIIANTHSF